MSRRSAITAGVRQSDVILTAALLALSLVQVLWVQPLGSLPVSLLVTFGAVLPLAWRRARPVLAAFIGTAAWLVPTEAFLFVGFVVAILLFFSVGRWAASWPVGALVCAWGLGVGTVGTLQGPEEPVAGLFSTWLAVLASYVVGRVMRAQEQEAEERLESEREATRLRAVEEERSRIVSELHDVLGHEVTLIAIQSEAASQALALAPAQAARPVAAVRETAQRASRELRAILGLLGQGELPVATDERGLSELTDRAARLGIPSSVTLTGTPWPDAPQHWLAVNRIVQECLTNAGKHAPGEKVDVLVDWTDDAVHVRVTNPAPAPSSEASGMGLPGLTERARLLGGTLDADHDGARFTVTARLPATTERT
ncbi:MAG TPA: histidine kinase, partial [Nocardioides sp.]|nr:histidine kinase [Nocardioides sp.]